MLIDDHELKSIPHDSAIIQSKTCFSPNPIFRSFIGSAFKMTVTVENTTMDVVRRLFMFKDDCILVTPLLVPHGKRGELELYYLVRGFDLEKVADIKYVRKEQRNFIWKPRKVKMKLYQQIISIDPFTRRQK